MIEAAKYDSFNSPGTLPVFFSFQASINIPRCVNGYVREHMKSIYQWNKKKLINHSNITIVRLWSIKSSKFMLANFSHAFWPTLFNFEQIKWKHHALLVFTCLININSWFFDCEWNNLGVLSQWTPRGTYWNRMHVSPDGPWLHGLPGGV